MELIVKWFWPKKHLGREVFGLEIKADDLVTDSDLISELSARQLCPVTEDLWQEVLRRLPSGKEEVDLENLPPYASVISPGLHVLRGKEVRGVCARLNGAQRWSEVTFHFLAGRENWYGRGHYVIATPQPEMVQI